MGVGRRRSTVVSLTVAVLVLAGCSGASSGQTTTTFPSTVISQHRPAPTTSSTTGPDSGTGSDSTTTTDGSIVTTPPTGGVDGQIGVVGCSNTDQAVAGYIDVSSEDSLTPGDLGGGTMSEWGDPAKSGFGEYWGLYDSRRPAGGYSGTWVQLCIRSGEIQGDFDEVVSAWSATIVDQILERDPGIPIWFSPINSYGGGAVCSAIGADGPEVAASAADLAANTMGEVSRGPDLGPLTPDLIGRRDDCHPNMDGSLFLGQQLADFFD